jgi:hypothetical protein
MGNETPVVTKADKDDGGKKKKDVWDILDIVFKGLLAVFVSGGIAFYGIVVDSRQAADQRARIENTEKNRQQQALIQILNSRETASASLRSQMFKTLLENYFDQKDPASQIVVLEMIGLNFRDSIQVRPMFERLSKELERRDASDGPELRSALRKAAGHIIEDQLLQIDLANEGATCELELRYHVSDSPSCFGLLAVMLDDDPTESSIHVRVNSLRGEWIAHDNIKDGDDFDVTFFDMPMVDYTRMIVGESVFAFSIVLKSTDPENREAVIAVAVLPDTDYSVSQAYKFDELLRDYLREVY